MTVIDVHTHMFSRSWLEQIRAANDPHYEFRINSDGVESVFAHGAQFLTPLPGHFDYGRRVAKMDEVGVDISIVSLTAPNVFFGGEAASTAAARAINDDMAQAQRDHPDRIRWMASLPWEYPDAAVAELARAHAAGAVGVMVLANIRGRHLTDPLFAPVWAAIDALALPVLVHPTTPPGSAAHGLEEFVLTPAVGFMFDTSVAIARMIYSGFLDAYPNLTIIASHAGGALPYLAGRLDQCFTNLADGRKAISMKPSEYMRRIAYDAVTYHVDALKMCLDAGGDENVMYGSDYPHKIGDMEGCLARVDMLPAERRKAVRGRNAERIFRL